MIRMFIENHGKTWFTDRPMNEGCIKGMKVNTLTSLNLLDEPVRNSWERT